MHGMHLNIPTHIQNPSFNPSKCKILKKWVDASYNGSKMAKIIVLKVHINGKNVQNQCLMGPMW
jgi:hypothetical protein